MSGRGNYKSPCLLWLSKMVLIDMDNDLSIMELENSFMDDLNELDDWFLQYEYLLAISADMPHISEAERTEEIKVAGCQSNVWLIMDYVDGNIHVRADSEALIIRGIISIVVSLFDGRTPKEIAAYTPRFIKETNIEKQISTDRFRGIHTIINTVQNFAVRCL